MDEQEQARQALMEMFRRDRTEAQAHPVREPRRELDPRARAWILAIVVVILIIGPGAFLVIYPRFGPVDTMTSFCKAEADGEYSSAYALLSQQAQARVTLDSFTRASQNTVLVSCSPSHGIPVIFGGTQASLDVSYQVVGHDAFNGSMSFVREHGEWRVDSMAPDIFSL